MTENEIQSYMLSFIKECREISNGLLSRKITNQEIGKKFLNLSKEDIFTELEYMEQKGYIRSKSKIPFNQKSLIKSFVLTEKAMS